MIDEQSLLSKVFQYGGYIAVAVLGWFLRRHVEKSDMKEKEQDGKLDILDKRVDEHDVSRADLRAQIQSIYQILQKMDRNIDKLLDK